MSKIYSVGTVCKQDKSLEWQSLRHCTSVKRSSLLITLELCLAWDSLRENTVMDGEIVIEKRTGEVLGPEVDYTRCS